MRKYLLFAVLSVGMIFMHSQRIFPAIDIHTHIVTDDYLSFLERNSAMMEDGYPLPSWNEASHLAFMDSADIEISILTLSSPHPWFGDIEESRKVCRAVNMSMAEVKKTHPDRFMWCAVLPQSNVEASIRELVYALDSLGADGIKLATNVDGKYLGDTIYEPLMEELDRYGAVVVLHPVKPKPINESVFTGGTIFVYEYPAETTRAVLNMVAQNVMTRYPNIKFIVPHSGSFLPYAIPRLKGGYQLLLNNNLTDTIDIDGNLARLYYDLAGGPSVQAIKMLMTITTPDHIMYGSDYPFVPSPILNDAIVKMRHDISEDGELRPYVKDFFTNNAHKLFKKEQ